MQTEAACARWDCVASGPINSEGRKSLCGHFCFRLLKSCPYPQVRTGTLIESVFRAGITPREVISTMKWNFLGPQSTPSRLSVPAEAGNVLCVFPTSIRGPFTVSLHNEIG